MGFHDSGKTPGDSFGYFGFAVCQCYRVAGLIVGQKTGTIPGMLW